MRWNHQIYGRCFDYREIVKQLEMQYPAKNGYPETKKTIVVLNALRFKGEFIPDSFVLSTAAWFAGRIGRPAEEWLTGIRRGAECGGKKGR